ncbi:MAG: hypothetical protein IPM79_24360 [Polyangiaceae bacterium]|nr:hypothetical protein [Polyangiaceae bacterium]MBK8940661.1 hypothetical protein [Polyangiaceae bacterium]
MATAAKKKTKKSKSTKAGKSEFGAKAEFIRSKPLGMPANQVVEEGAKQGLSMSANHVYAVRAEMRKKQRGSAKTATPPPSVAPARAPATTTRPSNLEAQLRHAIAELGLARARAILAEIEKAFAGG